MEESQVTDMLAEVKKYLHITWIEDDENIKSLIQAADAFLLSKSGHEKIDYKIHYKARSLLKDYVRYAWNHSLELFSVNFRHDILSFSLSEGVRKRNEVTTDGSI